MPRNKTARPGSNLMPIGGVVALIGIILAIVAVSSTRYDPVTGTETSGVPIAGIIIVLLGIALAGIGYARRVLAALEHREDSPKVEDPAA